MITKLLQHLFRYEKKESRTSGLTALNIGQPVWTPRDYANLARAGYQTNSDVFTAVTLIANAAKQIRLFAVSTDGEALPYEHPLMRLITMPNPRMVQSQFVECCISYLLLSGNRYIERVGPGSTEEQRAAAPPVELWPIRPDRMRIIAGPPSQPIAGYLFTGENGQQKRFEPWAILHQKTFHPLNDLYGMAPAEAAGYPIDISNESAALYKKLLQKGYPAGWIQPEGDWTDEQIAAFKRGLKQRERDNDWLFGQGIAAMHTLGFNPENARIVEGRLAAKRDIAAIYRVPPEMMGDTRAKTFANFQEARKSLYTEAALPELVMLVDGLNAWLSPLFDGATIQIDKDSIAALQQDRELTARRAVRIFTANLVTRNEARREMGFEDLPGNDVFYWQLPRTTAGGAAEARQDTADDNSATDDILQPGKQAKNPRIEVSVLALKSFDLLSEEAKDEYWKAFEQTREQFYRRWIEKTTARFDEERRTVLLAFRNEGEPGALRAVDLEADEWDLLYKALYTEVAIDFGKRVLAGFKTDPILGAEMKAPAMDIFTRAVLDWLARDGAKLVTGVSNATKEKIRHELAEGVKRGETMFELSKRLEDLYRTFSAYRAERIARTEVIRASNLGSQTAARQTGLTLEKEWIATFDDRTRSPHRTAHGQTRDLNVPYDVKGERLMFPGDISLGASAANTVHCRCTESYRTKR